MNLFDCKWPKKRERMTTEAVGPIFMPNSIVLCFLFTSFFLLPRSLFTSQKHDPFPVPRLPLLSFFTFSHFLSLTLHSLSFLLLFSPSVSYLTPSLISLRLFSFTVSYLLYVFLSFSLLREW
ncbi:MAG: hypothetical protein JOS17DRAFT_756488 [Linnemannia elongata]|nr:MAG: hypothetical protein JOS17DRAFT_756488 [Linnemannia elongata]